MKFQRYRFGNLPSAEFDIGGPLHGWEPYDDSGDPRYAEAEATFLRLANEHLYAPAAAKLSEEEIVGVLPDGRIALLSDTMTGVPFWIETR